MDFAFKMRKIAVKELTGIILAQCEHIARFVGKRHRGLVRKVPAKFIILNTKFLV